MSRKKLTIEEMKAFAKSKGGRCLSKKYLGIHLNLVWQCENRHVWNAEPNSIKNGNTWCPKCGIKKATENRIKYTIEDMQKLARIKEGKCLSEKYVNVKTNLLWQCKEGHQWRATPTNIKNKNTWCPKCTAVAGGLKRRLSIEDMQAIANHRGGKCISAEYRTAHIKLVWQCKEGHQWLALPSNILSGRWCRICSIRINADKERGNIEDMHSLAKSREGDCLSTQYIDCFTKLTWQCKKGHSWEAQPSNIKSGQWCPYCLSSRKENKCRKWFEYLLKTKFPRKKPEWLINFNGNRMELDGYSEELKLAFEYNGEQHYAQNHWFHQNRTFEEQKIADTLKNDLCKARNITLITIPYNVKERYLREHISEQLKTQVPCSNTVY